MSKSIFHVMCSCVKCKLELTTANLKQHADGCLTRWCKHCNTALTGNKQNMFCNQSCAAKYNNKTKSKENIAKQKASLANTIEAKKQYNDVECVSCSTMFKTANTKQNICDTCSERYSTAKRQRISLNVQHCATCGVRRVSHGRFQHVDCPHCRSILEFRSVCSFSFDIRKYPNELDLELLSEHGMFHPKRNPQGVSRDHMYSVYDGHINKVDPEIIKHPANCQLMLQSDNTRKHGLSSITLEQLFERIRKWNETYN